MRFGKRALAVRLLLLVLGAITFAVPTFAQTRNRDVGADVFRSFGVGSEIGVSVRELSSEEISKARLERAGGVYVQNVREESPHPGRAFAVATSSSASMANAFEGSITSRASCPRARQGALCGPRSSAKPSVRS